MSELRRGTVALYAERGEYTAKLRPGVIVQHEATLDRASSVTLCGLTTALTPPNEARVPIRPSSANGLDTASDVMVDKIVSISRGRIRQIVGQLAARDQAAVDQALRRWLDL